jgi:hypothetical protein
MRARRTEGLGCKHIFRVGVTGGIQSMNPRNICVCAPMTRHVPTCGSGSLVTLWKFRGGSRRASLYSIFVPNIAPSG